MTPEQLEETRTFALAVAQARKLADPDTAADVAVQSVWRTLEKTTPDNFTGWMHTVVHRRILDAQRHEISVRRRAELIEQALREAATAEPELSWDKCVEAVGYELACLIRMGYSFKEIAEMQDTSVAHLRKQIKNSSQS